MRFDIRRRLLFLGLGVALFMGMYSAGAAEKMTPEEAEEVRDQFEEQIADIDQNGIFFNNMGIALGMFVPGVGIGLGSLSGYVTGNVFHNGAILPDPSGLLEGVYKDRRMVYYRGGLGRHP